MASESNNFTGGAWQTYSESPTFSLSPGNGLKTVYFKVKNANGESEVRQDTINYVTATTTTTVSGLSTTTTTTVKTGETINISFWVGRTRGHVPLTVPFSPDYDPVIAGYLWNFGDGDISIEKEPVHIYQKPGRYTVTLTVYDSASVAFKPIVKKHCIIALPKMPCVLTSVLEDKDDIKALHNVRDKMLNSNMGVILSSLYYRHTNEISAIVETNPQLRTRLKNLVFENMAAIKCFISDKRMPVEIKANKLRNVINFLGDLKAHASPELQGNIDFIINRIEAGTILKAFDVTVQ